MKFYEHQQKIITADPKKCGLFLGTGSGKTRIALSLGRGTDILVICPKTQKEDGNWEREYTELRMWEYRSARMMEGMSFSTDRITVMSKEEFRRDAWKLKRYDTVIVDEAHTCLGATPNVRWVQKKPVPKVSQLYQELLNFIKRTNPDRLYLVTATIMRNPMTVWAAGILLGKDWNFYDWRDAFYFKLPMPGREVFTAISDSPTKDRLAKVAQKIGFVGRLEDYFDVPEQTYKTVYLDLSDSQKRRIKELALEYPDPLVLIGKKHQVENGVLTGDEFKAAEVFENKKIEKLLELSEEFPRMVIFAKYTAQIAQIASAFKDSDKMIYILDGSTKDRGNLIKEANNCHNGIFIAQAQVSAGWELPEWECMVFASMSYSIIDRIQAEGRILRANALKKNIYITLVIKEGIDQAVFDSIENKKDFNERLYLDLK